MELDSDHVISRCAAVARVVEEIAANSDLCAVGVLLLQAIIYTDLRVHDVMFAVVWNVLAADESDCVGTFADSGDASSKTSKFICVGFAPQFLVLGVYYEVPHFHEVTHDYVMDSVEHVGGALP
jgi:hypothetical protein